MRCMLNSIMMFGWIRREGFVWMGWSLGGEKCPGAILVAPGHPTGARGYASGWISMKFTWISPFAVRTLPIIRTREFHMKSVKIDILGWDSLYGQTSAKCKYILFRLFYTIMIYQTQKNNMIGKGNDLLAKAMREMTVKYRNRQTKLHQFTMNVRRVTMIVRFIIRKTEAVQLLVEVWS